jgi:hypothetical protein
MKNNKAPGEDSINVELFKYFCQSFLIRFLIFLNRIWEGEEPPKIWMKSVVIPIFKNGNRKDCDRAKSLLNTCYKIYANIIKNKLNKYYDNIIGEEQNVFRKGRSCCDGYFTMKILIKSTVNLIWTPILLLQILKKAFDRVNRKELLRILASDQVPQQTIQNI